MGDDSISIDWKLGGIAVAGGSLLGAANAGQNGNGGQPVSGECSEDHFINRYEAALQAEVAELRTEVKLRDANTYTDQKSLEMYRYIDCRLHDVEAQVGTQAFHAIDMHTGNYDRLKWRCALRYGFAMSSAWKHSTFGLS